MPFPNTIAGTYQGPHRPDLYSADQVFAGRAGPLYVPPPQPAIPPGGGTPAPPAEPRPPFRLNSAALPPWMRPLSERQFGGQPSGNSGPINRAGATGAPSPYFRGPSGGGGGSPLAGSGPSSSPSPLGPPPAPAFTPSAGPAPYAPGGGPSAFNVPGSTDFSGAASALRNLRSRVNVRGGPRAELGGPAGDNVWETLALERFNEGFDPGTQFEGKDLSDSIFSEAQINQMAQQRAAPTLRALRDADEMFASAAGRTGTYNPAARAAMQARAAIEGAGAINSATRDAQLDATAANAEQAARAAANRRENFSTDIAARLGLGNLGLSAASDLLSGGLQRRGLDQTRDLSRYQGDLTMRGQDLDASTTSATLNNARDLARASGERELAGLRENASIERGRLGLAARGQDIDRLGEIDRARLTARGQDIGAAGEADRLRLGARGQDLDFENAQADRQNRLTMLDRQLADSSLDRQTRAELERERMALDRELRMAQMQQDASQFESRLGLDRDQFGQTIGENRRQFDAAQQLTREQGTLNRDLSRYINTPREPQINSQEIQRLIEDALRRQMDGGIGGERPLTRDDIEELLQLAQFN